MKHIKHFEDMKDLKVGKYYWKIKSLPNDYKFYLIKYLKKIDCPDNLIIEFCNHVKYLDKDSPLYIMLNVTEYKEIWNLTKIQSTLTNQNFINLGIIELNDNDLKEIEIEKEAEKYNL